LSYHPLPVFFTDRRPIEQERDLSAVKADRLIRQ